MARGIETERSIWVDEKSILQVHGRENRKVATLSPTLRNTRLDHQQIAHSTMSGARDLNYNGDE